MEKAEIWQMGPTTYSDIPFLSRLPLGFTFASVTYSDILFLSRLPLGFMFTSQIFRFSLGFIEFYFRD